MELKSEEQVHEDHNINVKKINESFSIELK